MVNRRKPCEPATSVVMDEGPALNSPLPWEQSRSEVRVRALNLELGDFGVRRFLCCYGDNVSGTKIYIL